MKCRSVIKPTDIEILESKVFTYQNIVSYEENVENIIIQGYEFDMYEYEKDEYIQEISKKNDNLENQIIDTQIALCNIYESIKG